MANTNNNRDNNNKHLFYLNELSDYKVASDDPDVRGWEVQDRENRVVGKVDNLLVNKNTNRVVYLDVDVDQSIIEANHKPYRDSANDGVHEFINKDGENHLILPVGLVRLNTDKNFVYTDRIDHSTFSETKRIEKGANVDREYEIVVLESYERADRNTATGTSNGDAVTGTKASGVADRQNDPAFQESRGRKADNLTGTDKNVEGTTSRDVTDKDLTGKQNDPAFQERKQNDPAFENNQERKSNRDYASEDDDSFYERKEFDRTNYKNHR
ncbi:PRC-barrel domain-containing protein [Salegentibacter sp. F188]|uniref:PRC-barrel domain-containing protein n=1 Tax=Autumnicola patrickiae TaxID=3075591 RepID=A0ABU3E6K4_9FLAO|nr:PRC-barrel domain-containing protein [Salegentibacter sp. F188]MDT0691614.1 PRC-barrel domain-containing protein [Salegentibacter sp. F188]